MATGQRLVVKYLRLAAIGLTILCAVLVVLLARRLGHRNLAGVLSVYVSIAIIVGSMFGFQHGQRQP